MFLRANNRSTSVRRESDSPTRGTSPTGSTVPVISTPRSSRYSVPASTSTAIRGSAARSCQRGLPVMEYSQTAPSCQRSHSGVTCGPRALTVPSRQVTSLCRNSSISSRLMAIRLPRRCVCNCCSLIVSTLAVPLRVTPTSRLDHVAAGSGIRLWAEQSLTEQHRLIAGRYRLLEHVGRGAMGIVWRAHDESLDRPVAVKEFVYTDTDGTNGADATSERRRVMREGRIAARLQH